MNKTIVLLLSLISFQYGQAQSNSFPANGSVGIGTTTPLAKVEVRVGGIFSFLKPVEMVEYLKKNRNKLY